MTSPRTTSPLPSSPPAAGSGHVTTTSRRAAPLPAALHSVGFLFAGVVVVSMLGLLTVTSTPDGRLKASPVSRLVDHDSFEDNAIKCDKIMEKLRKARVPRVQYSDKQMRFERQSFSHCFQQVNKTHYLMAGHNKHVVSMSLFTFGGPSETYQPKQFSAYAIGIAQNLLTLSQVLPGWIIRVFVSNDAPPGVVKMLKVLNCEVVVMPSPAPNYVFAMTWRFLVADDGDVARFLVRDADSRVSTKDRQIIERWTSDRTPVCIARDHPSHRRPIMGGTWGGTRDFRRAANLTTVRSSLETSLREKGTQWARYSMDQNWLKSVVWEAVENVTSQFDASFIKNQPPSETRQKYCKVATLCYKTPPDVAKNVFLGKTFRSSNQAVDCVKGHCEARRIPLKALWNRLAPPGVPIPEGVKE